ncbi:MAG: hypothetical protein WB308_03480, partial [Sulfuricurvum sp.]
IRLLDLSTITEDQINTPNRRRAETLPIWEHIKDSYSIKEFMQVETPLEKIEKITYRYSLEDAEKSIKKVITRLFIHDRQPTFQFFLDVLQRAREDFEMRKLFKNKFEEYKEETSYEDDFKTYSDEGLQNLEASLSKEMHTIPQSDPEHQKLFDRYVEVCRELDRRDLNDDNPWR